MYRPTSSALASLSAALERGVAIGGRRRWSQRGGPWREIALGLALVWMFATPLGVHSLWGVWMFVAASATLGVAHGALDIALMFRPRQVARQGRPSAGPSRRAALRLGAYLAASGTVLAVLAIWPAAVMPLLLGFAVFHFASGVGVQAVRIGRPKQALPARPTAGAAVFVSGDRAKPGRVTSAVSPALASAPMITGDSSVGPRSVTTVEAPPADRRGVLWARLCFIAFVGAAPLAAPALLRPTELAATLALLPPGVGDAANIAWRFVTGFWCVGVVGMAWRAVRARFGDAAESASARRPHRPVAPMRVSSNVEALEEVLTVFLLNTMCPPLVAFSIYFALVHSARHIEAVLRWRGIAAPAADAQPGTKTTRAVLAVALIAGVTLGGAWWLGPSIVGTASAAGASISLDAAGWLHVALLVTAAVTVPHAALVARRAALLYAR